MTETLPEIHLSLVGYNPNFPWKLYKEEINENIRLRKLPSVLLLQVHINIMPLLLLMFCTVSSCYTFRYTVTYHCLNAHSRTVIHVSCRIKIMHI